MTIADFDLDVVVNDEVTDTGDHYLGAPPCFGIQSGDQEFASRELVDQLMLGTQQDFAEPGSVWREQSGADLLGFDSSNLASLTS